MTDTTKEMEARYQELLLARSPAKRVAMACGMFSTAKALVRAGILKNARESISPQELRSRIFIHIYGLDFDSVQRKKILDHLQSI